ncbi:SDR family NAD(P)-dependent oxidoreductase [Chitinophaga filiformis]|uniref:SDR family NAD(P)-dependent oxidoreductase n=1 Tax=Chitinophaga filiformis TaxID=104663 RepID=A0ABY4IA61_CHIFI|nr:SDR family NAD(P)-dependent oxidoreductase [Chitinophaga filiformis]UPK71681.1 SDR family NAD(P)-dependent oxidoreductase [Chitinophaga filiformis]
METRKKVWLVTGSGNGLGKNIAETALKAGHIVVATARKQEQLADLASRYGSQVLTAVLDVTDEGQAKNVVDMAVQQFGYIDVLVNNAGYGDNRPFEQVPAQEFRQLVETCFFGVVTLTREVLPFMRKQKSGHIIQISSAGGRTATPGNAAYHAAKWAVGGFTESLAQETAAFNVKVTALEPGGIRTNWGKRAFGNTVKLLPEYEPTVGATIKFLENYWGNENSDPEKVAQVVLRVAETDQLPPHILIGSDAYNLIKQGSQKTWQDAENWKDVTTYTDFQNRMILPDFLKG